MFHISPASSGPIIFFVVLSLFLIALLGFFGYIIVSAHTARFDVTEAGLQIRNTVYGKFIPRQSMDLSNIQVVNLKTNTDLQAQWRTNGVGLPGYAAGWFKLKNGEKALVFMTDSEHVLYIPTNLGYAVLLSTPDTDKMRNALMALR